MLLRRVTQHVKSQNWFAVCIDFIIVVVGVFIGIQVANWSALQGDMAEYQRALDRLDVELAENTAILDGLDPDLKQSLINVQLAFAALQSCVENAANRQAINKGLEEIRGTYGMHLRRDALDELTTSPRLLALQNKSIKKRLSDMSFSFGIINADAKFYENHPLEGRFQNNPIIGIGEQEIIKAIYYGVDYSQPTRKVYLKVPVNEACQNDQLVKSFFTWEAWQDNMPIFSRQIRKELLLTQAMLPTERQP